MTRYPIALPEFMRVAWVSDEAREHYQPTISAIAAMRSRLERETVYRGIRSAAIVDVAPDRLTDEILSAVERGAVAFPLALVADTDTYSARGRPAIAGERQRQRVAVCNGAVAAEFRQAFETGDDDTIGALLGFPACCRAFFRQVWVADRRIDPTWQQATAGQDDRADVEVQDFEAATNVLGRWLGVRQVPHLPCSFFCRPTVEVAERWRYVAKEIGLISTWLSLESMTRWPVEWSAAHGIAEIVTPVYRIVTGTDGTAERISIKLFGDIRPDFAALGLRFPYPSTGAPIRSDIWTANGFSSLDAMRRAHDVIVRGVRAWRPVPGSVLDLGCGTGELVRALATQRRGGVDISADKIATAVERDRHGVYRVGDLRDDAVWPIGPWDVVVCMIGRLTEGETTDARAQLRDRPTALYAYSDWLAGRSIDDLIREVGYGDRVERARIVTPDAAVVVVE